MKRMQHLFAAFNSIKAYLIMPLVMASPVKWKPKCCISLSLSISLVLCYPRKRWREGKCLILPNLMLVGPEERYFPIKKVCLALIFAIQKLHHYTQHHTRSWSLRRILSSISSTHYKWVMSKIGNLTSVLLHQIHPPESEKRSGTRRFSGTSP